MIKTATVQALTTSGGLVFNETFAGKKNTTAKLREAAAALGNRNGYLRNQTVGAKGWAVYECQAGASRMYLLTAGEKRDEVLRGFELLTRGSAGA
jgi:hypothetical protein